MDGGSSKCKYCGCELSKLIKVDNKWLNVCRTCGKVYYIRCDKCGGLFSERHIHCGGRKLCELCRETELVQCDQCGIYVEPREARVRKEQIFCSFCAEYGQAAHRESAKHPERQFEPDTVIIKENDEEINDELRRKVDLGAAALWLATKISSDENVKPDGKIPREGHEKARFDRGNCDEGEHDSDSDLY